MLELRPGSGKLRRIPPPEKQTGLFSGNRLKYRHQGLHPEAVRKHTGKVHLYGQESKTKQNLLLQNTFLYQKWDSHIFHLRQSRLPSACANHHRTPEKDRPGRTVFTDQTEQISGALRRYLYPQKQRKICLHPHEKQ